MHVIYSKQIVTPKTVQSGYLVIEDGKIKDLLTEYEGPFIDYSDAVILPGFIDQHTHGWGRGSFLYENNEKSIRMMIEDQAKEGVTGFLATTFTDSLDNIFQSLEVINKVQASPHKGTKLLGVHLEGPFLNPEFGGAQKVEHCLLPNLELMKRFVEYGQPHNFIKLITIAPELAGAQAVIEYCRSQNIQVAAGHTGATFEELLTSKIWGVSGVTHMYSAMTGLHHRQPGVVGAALYDADLYCEFAKQTGITVRHEVFDFTYRLKGANKIIMTTDCLGNGMQVEPYYHARRNVHFIPKPGYLIERFEDGTEKIYDLNDYESLRDIELSFVDSIRNVLKYTAMSWNDLAKITSTNSANYLNLPSKGTIEVGKDADFTIITPDVEVIATIVEGEWVYETNPSELSRP